MLEPSRLQVKICGVMRSEDARHAAAAGADYVGTILSPGHPRSIEPARAGEFRLGEGVTLAAIFVDATVADAAAAARIAGAGVIQLHGDERSEQLRALREEGAWKLWKAIRVRSSADIASAAERWAGVADGLLLDGFREGAAGGHGAGFPWEALEAVRHEIPAGLTLIVAGGLTPDSVQEAVTRLAPDVVDVSSGVEVVRGVKDSERVRSFVERARAGAAEAPAIRRRPVRGARVAEAG
jgi:phosphoribosylanthranilate isomerase